MTETTPEGVTNYSYDSDDRLLAQDGPEGIESFDYDANGNETEAGTRSFTYGQEGMMHSLTDGAETRTYTYDGDGHRLKASTGENAADKTKYLWDVNNSLAQLAVERDGDDQPLRTYVHGDDLISMLEDGEDSYFHYDGLGSVTNVTDADGAEQWSYEYEPFGTSTPTQIDPAASDNPMRFTGEYQDPSGQYFLRARQYDRARDALLRWTRSIRRWARSTRT